MGTEFALAEIMAIFAENLAAIYFLHSRFKPKFSTFAPELFAVSCVVVWGIVAFFTALPGYEFAFIIIYSLYVFLTKNDSLLQKFVGIILLNAIILGTSLVGAGIVAILMDTTIYATLQTSDTARLVSLIFIKSIQVTLLYILSKKQIPLRSIGKIPAFVIGLVTVILFVFGIMVRLSFASPDLSTELSRVFILTSMTFLIITIGLFFMYELFVNEEARNNNLAMSLQRLELERGFFNEIDAIYKDIRAWRHEYKNNLIALRNLIDNEDKEKIIAFVEKISGEPIQLESTLQTGNLILDAIVSSKLGLAQRKNIEVDILAVYPNNNCIDDNDLCTVVGNLLDNAIEACGEDCEHAERRFIDFAFLAKGKNLVITVNNSFFHELKQENGKYYSMKDGLFHGIGLPLLDSIVHKYNGHIMRTNENGIFCSKIVIPLVPPGGEESIT